MSDKKEIKIAGAGIAGLTSAIVLAKAGYEAKVFEINSDVGKRFNGDFQGLMNWAFDQDILDFMQEIGLKTDFWKKPVNAIDVFGPKQTKYCFSMKEPFVYLVQRGNTDIALEKSLKQQAIDAGVEIIFNKKAEEEDVDIIATGPKLDGVTDAIVSGYTFQSDSKDMFVCIFDDKLAYNGYAYFFIADGRGTIATCIFDKFEKLNEYLEKTYNFVKKQYNFSEYNRKKFSGIGNFYLLKSSKKYVGEAGGFQDFLWGFGMRYAMLTGYLAAKSIIEGKEYKCLWEKELLPLLRTSISNRLWFSALGKHSYNRFIKIFRTLGDPRKIFGKTYNSNYFSKIIYTWARLKYSKKVKDRLSQK